MRNFTFSRSKLFRLNFLVLFLLLISYKASAQFYTKHYIAPAPWQYFSKANEIVIATNSTATVNITLKKSDGTLETNLTATKGAPAIYRFKLFAKNLPMNPLNTVINAAGLIIESTEPTSINMRNIASDDYTNGENVDANIKGNAALTSFGDAGIGIRFRVGYYRDGSLGNFNSLGDQRPIYSIMAITNGTSVTIDGTVKATLDAGQSYLFKAPIGTLVESSNPSVMNTSAAIDMPNGCGDGAFNQIPPESVLGSEYFIERGKGNDTAEQTTVVATKDNTTVTVDTYSATGVLTKTTTTVLATAGKFFTFLNGVSNTNFSASRVSADKNVAVYSGTAQSCEVDISTIAPVSECGGSNFIETAKFRNYGTGSLPYFGYILLKDATAVVNVNGSNIETTSNIAPRHQLGSTGWYIINFEDTQIGSPNVLSISSTAKLTVSIVQQGGGFSMAGFFSNFAAQPEDPTMTYVAGGGCTNNTATLTTPSGFAPYQWYYNGTAISGANSNSYIATKTGSYSVASTLACGVQTQSKPVSVTLCTDLGVTKTVDNATPCVGSNVEFTVKLSNLGVNNATGVSVNDLLPSGYTYVSATQSIGSYNSTTGVWSIGDVNGGITETLKIIAKVNATGVYTNTAALPSTTVDSNPANNSASVSTTPNPLPTIVITNPASVCSPLKVDITAPAITAGSSSNLTFTYWTNSTATTSYTTPTAATAGTYYIKATTAAGCSDIKPVVVTVATPPNAGTLSGTQNICVSGTTTFTSNGNTGGTWSSSDTTIATVNSSTGLVTGIAAGTATISYKVTGTGGCSDATATRTVTVTTPPNAGTLSGTQNICVSGTTTFTSNGNTGGTWSSSDTTIATVNASTGLVTGIAAGTATISYKVTGTGGCSDATATRTVTVTTPPNAGTLSGTQNICVSGTTTFTSNGNTGGAWSSSDTTIATVNASTGLVTGIAAGTATISYKVTGTGGCSDATATRTVTVTTPPNAGTLSGTQNICVSGTTTFTSNGNTGGAWSSSDTTIATVNASTGLITGITAGTATISYKVTGTGSCSDATATRTVTVNPFPTATITGTLTACLTTTLTAVSNASSATYIWYKDNVVIAGETASTLIVIQDGDYKVKIKNTVTTCEETSAVSTVKVSDTQKPTITCPANVTAVADAGSCTATGVALGTPATTDNCGVASVINNAPTAFPIGTTTVIWTVTDTSGNTQTCTQTVTITDTQKPTIMCPANVTAVADAGSCTAAGVALGTPTTADNCGVASVTNDAPAIFTIGTTTVTWTVTDNSGNTQTCTQKVNVVGPIKANDDIVSSFNGYSGGIAVSNVLNNDLLNCNNVIGNDVTISLASTLPSVLIFNTSTGAVTLKPLTPAGEYTFDYTICEKINSTNCSTATVKISVVAPVIDAVTETTTSINGSTGGTTISLINNDTLNGNPAVIGTNPGEVKLTGITVPTGLTLNADGTVTVAPNTPSGNYEIEYSICEITNPTNCDAVKSTIAVGQPTIDAVTETTTSINGSTGGTTASLINNDTLNGNPAVIGTNPGEVKLTGITVPTGLTLNADGTVTVAPNTPSGNYEIEYSICEITNPTNCDAVKSTIAVGQPTIDAVTETIVSINGSTGGTTVSLINNDTLNGNPAVIGTNPGEVKLTGITVPIGLTLNADGTVTVAPNTPSGNYEIEYSICEVNNPTNCDAVKSTIVVGQPTIDAVTETTTSINGSTGGTTASLINNDTLNGNPAVIGTDPGEVKLTGITVPTGLTLNADGTVTVAPNTPLGNYEIEYSICEVTNPTNCDAVKSTIAVGQPAIDAVTETTASINGSTGGTTASLINNDTLNGNPAVIGTNPGEVKLTGITVPTGLTLNADGTVTVAPNTPLGNYEIEYSICEVTNPTNCDAVKSTIAVGQPAIDAVTETTASINGSTGGTTASLINNDTLNGNPAVIGTDPGEVKLTGITVPTGLTLNADGTVTVAPNTPLGNYEIEYSICEVTNPTNCDAVKSTIVVGQPTIDAVTETTASINGSTGGTTASLINNDTLNGNPAVIGTDPGEVKLTGITVPTGLTLNADGTVTVAPNTPSGNYEIEYSICEITNPTNCDAVKSYISVTGAVLQANNDNAGTVDSNKGQSSTTSIFHNDTLNGLLLNPADVTLTTVVPNPYLILKSDGTIQVKAGTPAGDYELTYQICEVLNPSNCSQAVAKITVVNIVDPNPPTTPLSQIVLNNDSGVSVDGINGSLEFINVLDNDLLKGLPINPLDVIITNTPNNPYFEFNSDGTVNVKPNTPGGNYSLIYQVCEKANSSNCATATLSVFVEVPAIAIIKTAVFNDENGSGFANAGETITYKFKITNTGNVPLKNVMVTDPLLGVVLTGQPIDLEVNESDEHNFTATYKITQNDINKGSVSNQATVKGTSARGVVVEDKSDDENNTGDKPTVLPLSGCVIKVFNAFSPNGDDKNSRFYIQGLECYPDNTVEIYNRWGVLVYDIDKYNNDDRAFKGFSEGRTTVKQADGLPVGTYFYILKYKDSESNPHELSGYLYINK